MMKFSILNVLVFLFVSCLNSQNTNIIGGSCEGCQAIYEYDQRNLSPIDTLPGYAQSAHKIKITGTVFQIDGISPAKDVILYLYQTNAEGKYPKKTDSKGWEARHGFIRTWLKTDSTGYYEFYTGRPASYPNSSIPQHIHIVVKEPNKMEYYIEDFFFADDPNITDNIVHRKHPRGGSGVVRLKDSDNLKIGIRDIILGLHVPNY